MNKFKHFIALREGKDNSSGGEDSGAGGAGALNQDWKKGFVQLEKGFVPPPKLRPVIEAFLDSGNIQIMDDVSKPVKMPKKSLFLVGGPVRDFLKGKTPKDLDLATNATPEQIALILHNAGFKVKGKRDESGKVEPSFDVSGKQGKKFELSFTPEVARPGDNKFWYLKGRDASNDGKPFVIGAVVDGEEFDLATFRKDAKVTDGQAAVDFVDNPNDDAARRDLTINALYIELSKADGENSKLFDPTKQGWHDVMHGQVRTVGRAEDRFKEDKLRIMRAIRFHCRFGKGTKLHKDIEEALPKFKNLSGVSNERIRDEFLKGLLDPDVDPKTYLSIYYRTGLLEKVFPGVEMNMNIPTQFRDKRDKPLALAWILQNNPTDKVAQVLAGQRSSGEEDVPTGWTNDERQSVLYLLNLKEFDQENLEELLAKRKGTGLTDDQIRDWVDLFDHKDEKGTTRSSRPQWAKMVRAFADFKPDPRKLVSWHAKDDAGQRTDDIHPEIMQRGLHVVTPQQRGDVVKNLNRTKLKQMFGDLLPKNE